MILYKKIKNNSTKNSLLVNYCNKMFIEYTEIIDLKEY